MREEARLGEGRLGEGEAVLGTGLTGEEEAVGRDVMGMYMTGLLGGTGGATGLREVVGAELTWLRIVVGAGLTWLRIIVGVDVIGVAPAPLISGAAGATAVGPMTRDIWAAAPADLCNR